MKDLAIMGVQKIDTSKPENKAWFGFRKIFWTFLNKLHVPFYDKCCSAANGDDKYPVAYDLSQGQLVRYNPTTDTWVPLTSFTSTTTTTTLAPTTTTTTTVP
jgi:hypothetical protein